MSRVSIAELSAKPGARVQGWVRVPGIDPPWEMPAVVVRGAHEGPTLALTAGVHAAEYPPIEALTRLVRLLDPAVLRGTVLAIPLVNTPGFFEHAIYVNPRDGRNLGWGFPGDPDGTITDKVNAFLWSELIDGADAWVDIHGGDLIEALVPFSLWPRTDDPELTARCEGMSRAYGLDYALGMDLKNIPGRTYGEAARRGVAAIVGEVGQQGLCDEASVERHLQGLQHVMSFLGMLDPPETPSQEPRELEGLAWSVSDVSATFHPVVSAGEQVVKAQRIGELHDLFGETIRLVEAPATGIVVFLVTALAVKEGGPLIGVGVEDAAEAVDARASAAG